MGTSKENKLLDAFTKKYFNDINLENTSDDFTKNVLDRIALEKMVVKKHKPLISWKIWSVICLVIFGLIIFPFQNSEGSILSKVSFDFSLSEWFSKVFTVFDFSVSSITFYGILFFGIMISFQVFYLKGYFNRKISF